MKDCRICGERLKSKKERKFAMCLDCAKERRR